eukprot:3508386-Pleurochrysis_carterae.AAC.3
MLPSATPSHPRHLRAPSLYHTEKSSPHIQPSTDDSTAAALKLNPQASPIQSTTYIICIVTTVLHVPLQPVLSVFGQKITLELQAPILHDVKIARDAIDGLWPEEKAQQKHR